MKGNDTVHEALIAELDVIRNTVSKLLPEGNALDEIYPATLDLNSATHLMTGLSLARRSISRALLMTEIFSGPREAERILEDASSIDG